MRRRCSRNGGHKFLLIAMVLSCLAIVGINATLFIILACQGQLAQALEECAIGNIISILALATTTWIGLSITNHMDRSDFQDLREQAAQISEQFEVGSELAYKRLLDELYADPNVAISQWIWDQIRDMPASRFGANIWETFRDEEQNYQKLHTCSSGPEADRVFQHILNCLKDLRQLINGCDCTLDDRNCLLEILSLREMESQFLMGYCEKDPEKANKRFVDAVNFYQRWSKHSGFFSGRAPKEQDFEEIFSQTTKADHQRKRIMAYICNFIGESYSMIVFHYNRYHSSNSRIDFPLGTSYGDCCDLAYNYCCLAVKIAEDGNCERETYYRNFGCTIERTKVENRELPQQFQNELLVKKKIDGLSAAIEQYEKALSITRDNPKIFQCILSAYNKMFETVTNQTEYNATYNPQLTVRNRINPYMLPFKMICRWYLTCYPDKQDAHIKAMFYYRDAYMLCASEVIREALRQEIDIVNIIIPGDKSDNRIYIDALKICNLPLPQEP